MSWEDDFRRNIERTRQRIMKIAPDMLDLRAHQSSADRRSLTVATSELGWQREPAPLRGATHLRSCAPLPRSPLATRGPLDFEVISATVRALLAEGTRRMDYEQRLEPEGSSPMTPRWCDYGPDGPPGPQKCDDGDPPLHCLRFFEEMKSFMLDSDIHGSLCVLNSSGGIAGVFSRGQAQRPEMDMMFGNSPFNWTEFTRVTSASVAKMVTTMMLLRLHEAGLLQSLDQEIGSILPPFIGYENYLASGNAPVTFRHLLQHRTGWANKYADVKGVATAAEFADFFMNSPSYSGYPFQTIPSVDTGIKEYYGNPNFAILRLLLPMLTFPNSETRQQFWDLFAPLSQGEKLEHYNWWTAKGFNLLSWLVYQPAGLGSMITKGDPLSDALGYDDDADMEGYLLWDTFNRAGAFGIVASSYEYGQMMSALQRGKILGAAHLKMMNSASDRLGWQLQDGSKIFAHGGDGKGVHHLVAYFEGGGASILLTNRMGPNAWNSSDLWRGTLKAWGRSCEGLGRAAIFRPYGVGV